MTTKGTKARIGRPPRQDRPEKMLVTLPGQVRAWLRAQASREERTQSDVITDALALYRSRGRGKQ